MKNINTVYLYFQATVKKLAEFLDSSATPETSSMTISLSRVVFSPKILFTLFLLYVSSNLDIFKIHQVNLLNHFDLLGNET